MNLEDQLVQILGDLSLIATETSLILGALLLLIVGLISKNHWLIKGTFVGVLLASLVPTLDASSFGLFLNKSLILNGLNIHFSILLIITTLLVVLFPRRSHTVEFYFLILSLLIGSLFMIKANSLL